AKKGEGVRMEVFAFGNGFTDTFRTLLENYYAAIASGNLTGDWPTFEEGAQVTAVCCAAAKSAEEDSRWIAV
ncbi:MAG: gfo/Idh/MocA family oxidoreductase, partial [Firmicutes bacterium]|nr:gfo/Idh/MocA family oxidoreductase [Bacillota bacterium]